MITDPIIQLRMDIDAFKASINQAIQQLNSLQAAVGKTLGEKLPTVAPPTINFDLSGSKLSVSGLQKLAREFSSSFISELQKSEKEVQKALSGILTKPDITSVSGRKKLSKNELKLLSTGVSIGDFDVREIVAGQIPAVAQAASAANALVGQSKNIAEFTRGLQSLTNIQKQLNTYLIKNKDILGQDSQEYQRLLSIVKTIEQAQQAYNKSIIGGNTAIELNKKSLREQGIEQQKLEQAQQRITGLRGNISATGIFSPTVAPPTTFVDLTKTKITLQGLQAFQSQIRSEFINAINSGRLDLRSVVGESLAGFKQLEGTGAKSADIKQFASESAGAIDRIVSSITGISRQASSIKELQLSISQISSAQKNLSALILDTTKRFGEGSAIVSKYKDQLKILEQEQTRLNSELQKQNTVLKQGQEAYRQTNQFNVDFVKLMDVAIGKIIRYRIAFSVLHGTILQIKDTVIVFKDVDLALARLAKVLPDVGRNLDSLRQQAFNLGKTFGVSIKEVIQGMDTWAQMGLTQNEVLKATEAALVGVNTTGLTHQQVVEALTSAIFTYGVAVEDTISVIDKWTAVQQAYPVVGADLAQALFKVGSAAEDFGLTLDQLNGIVTAVQATTRASGREIGNAFKTIFARLQTQDAIRSFRSVGIAVKSSANEFRPLFDILTELGAKWTELSDVERANISQQAAGQRQYNKFIALMENFSLAQEAVSVSQNSLGASFRANALELNTFAKSWESLNTQLDEIKFAAGQEIAKPLQQIANLLRAIDSPTGTKIFGNVIGGLTVLGTTFVAVEGSVVAYRLVLSALHRNHIIAAADTKSLTTFLFGLKGAQDATTASTATLTSSLRAFATSTGGIALILGGLLTAWTLLTDKVEEFKEGIDSLRPSQSDFIQSLVEQANVSKETVKASSDLIVQRADILRQLSGTVKGTKEYEETLKSLGNTLAALEVVGGGQFAEIIAQEKQSAISREESTDRLNKRLIELNNTQLLYQQSLQRTFENEKDVFELTKKQNYDRLIRQLNDLSDQRTKLNNLAAAFRLSDIFGLDNSTMGNLKDSNALLNTMFNSFKENKQLSLSEDLIPGLEQIRLFTEDLNKTVEENLNILRNNIQSFKFSPEIAKTLSDELDIADKKFEGFFTKLKSSKSQEEFIETFNREFGRLSQEIDTRFSQAGTAFNKILAANRDELNDLTKQQTIFAKGFNFTESEQKIDSFFDKLGVRSREIIQLQRKFSDLKFNINDGAEAMRRLISESAAAGEPMRNIQQELAQFFFKNVKDVRQFVNDISSTIVQLEDSADEIRDQLASPVATDSGQKDQLTKQLNQTNANRDALVQLKADAEDYANSVIPQQIRKTKEQNDQLAIQVYNLSIINSMIREQSTLTSDVRNILKGLGRSEKELIDFDTKRLDIMSSLYAQEISLANEADKEVLARRRATELTEEQLRILRAAASVDIVRNIENLTAGIQSAVGVIESTLASIPEVINAGYEKRKELTREIQDAERELTEARISGDRDSQRIAKARLDFLNQQLEKSRGIIFEIKGLTENLFSGLSTAIFDSLSKRFAEDISKLQIGGESLGQQMGKAIAGEFNLSADQLITDYNNVNQYFIDQTRDIYDSFLLRLSELLGRQLPELMPQFNEESFKGFGSDLVSRMEAVSRFIQLNDIKGQEFGPPTPPDIRTINERDQNIKNAMRSGGLLAGQIIARYMGQAGGRVGQDIAAVLQTAGQFLLKDMKGTDAFLGSLGLSLSSGLLGGLLGSIFEQDEEPELPHAIDRNTAAIESNTLALKEFEKGIFNAPPNFVLSNNQGLPAGNITNYITVQVEGSNVSGEQIAQSIVENFDRTYRNGLGRTGTRSTRVVVI